VGQSWRESLRSLGGILESFWILNENQNQHGHGNLLGDAELALTFRPETSEHIVYTLPRITRVDRGIMLSRTTFIFYLHQLGYLKLETFYHPFIT